MRYPIIDQPLAQSKRKEYNEKILAAIDRGEDEINREIIFNCYTDLLQ